MEASQKHRAKVILDSTPHDPQNVQWPSPEIMAEAFAMYRAETGSSLKMNCPPCHFTVIDHLRAKFDLPPIKEQATELTRRQRLAICRGKAGDGSDKCDYLAWPGMNCAVCLCFIDIKAALKRSKCPAGKW